MRTSSALRCELSPLAYAIISLTSILSFCHAQCTTVPFCDKYPECSRGCLGNTTGNVPFYHSFGTDMDAICASGINRLAVTEGVFACVQTECAVADAQEAWNQFVDECAADGHTISPADTPTGYEEHLFEAVLPSSKHSITTARVASSTTGSAATTFIFMSTAIADSADKNEGNELRPGEIAGIVVGIVGALITALGVYHAWRNSRLGRKGGKPVMTEAPRSRS